MKPHWTIQVLEATRAQQTKMGAILVCAMGKRPTNPPYFDGNATIQENGEVTCAFVRSDNVRDAKAIVCTAEELVQNTMALANWCQLDEAEALELAQLISSWATIDLRPLSGLRRVAIVEK